jgi:hypothetical protein
MRSDLCSVNVRSGRYLGVATRIGVAACYYYTLITYDETHCDAIGFRLVDEGIRAGLPAFAYDGFLKLSRDKVWKYEMTNCVQLEVERSGLDSKILEVNHAIVQKCYQGARRWVLKLSLDRRSYSLNGHWKTIYHCRILA